MNHPLAERTLADDDRRRAETSLNVVDSHLDTSLLGEIEEYRRRGVEGVRRVPAQPRHFWKIRQLLCTCHGRWFRELTRRFSPLDEARAALSPSLAA